MPRRFYEPAVDHVNLSVGEGELFGLLGSNGAGKTTLIKLICTLIHPTEGEALVFGHPLTSDNLIKNQIGLVTSDERSFFWRLTGRENLEFFASLQGLYSKQAEKRIISILDQVKLGDAADKTFQTYSTGMRQRLSIARALLNDPRLLFLDEPSRGLDPIATDRLHRLILELNQNEGKTIFLTTHHLDEAERLCTSIAIMKAGRIQVCGTVDQIRTSIHAKQTSEIIVQHLPPQVATQLQEKIIRVEIQPIGTAGKDQNQAILIDQDGELNSLNQAIDILRQNDIDIKEITQPGRNLEQIFTQASEMNWSADQKPDSGLEFETNAVGPSVGGKNSTEELRRLKPDLPKLSNSRIIRAFLKRDWRSETSYRISFLLQIAGIFFSVSLFYFLSQFFGEAADPYLTGYDSGYFAFVLIGIAFAGYFSVGLSTFSQKIRNAQTTGTLEAMLTTPASYSTIIISSSIWDYLLTTFRVFIYLAIGTIFMGVSFQNANLFSAMIVLVLSIFAFSSLGIIAASFIMVLKRGDPVTWVVTSISSLLGGVYYPITVLPEGLQWLAMLLPITYSLRGMRLALLNGASIAEIGTEIVALCIFVATLTPISLVAFRYSIQRAKIDGSLTQY